MTEAAVRGAFADQLHRIARLTRADQPDDDAGWQARRNAATRAAKYGRPARLQDLVDAVDGVTTSPEPSTFRLRSGFGGLFDALAGSAETLAEEFVEAIGLLGLTGAEVEEMQTAQREQELEGTEGWGRAVEELSLRNFSRVLARSSLDELRRSTAVIVQVQAVVGITVLLGVVQVGSEWEAPEQLRRFDEDMLRRLTADPAWPWAQTLGLPSRPRQRLAALAVASLGLLAVPGLLRLREIDRDRLMSLVGWADERSE